jgi:hypothetical protein
MKSSKKSMPSASKATKTPSKSSGMKMPMKKGGKGKMY